MFYLNIILTSPQVWMAAKVTLGLALLILVRAGVPRYRLDYLTRVGWVRFLTLVIAVYSTALLLIFLA